MPNHHPSRSWRGCAMCKPHKRRGAGRPAKDPVSVHRRLGRSRRYSRRSLGCDDRATLGDALHSPGSMPINTSQ